MEFLNATPVLTTLRTLHIVLGFVWIGFAIVGAWVVHPASQKMGEKGDTLLRIFYGYSNYNKIFPIAAIGTTLAGLIMWPARVDGIDFVAFSDTGDIVMAVGAVFGLLAFGHGAGATGRFAAAYAKAARAFEESANPSEEQRTELETTRAKVFTHSNISTILTLIAVIAMSSARYL